MIKCLEKLSDATEELLSPANIGFSPKETSEGFEVFVCMHIEKD